MTELDTPPARPSSLSLALALGDAIGFAYACYGSIRRFAEMWRDRTANDNHTPDEVASPDVDHVDEDLVAGAEPSDAVADADPADAGDQDTGRAWPRAVTP